MTEMFGEAWSPMSVPDLAPDDDDDPLKSKKNTHRIEKQCANSIQVRPWYRIIVTDKTPSYLMSVSVWMM